MLTTRHGVRPLGAADLRAFLELTGRDPVVNVFAEHRARTTNLEPRWLGGEMWGRFHGGDLVAACHVGANLVPVQATEDDASESERMFPPSEGESPRTDVRPQTLGRQASEPIPERGLITETRDVVAPPLRGTDERVGGDSRGSSELNRASPEGKIDYRSGEVIGPGRK